MTLVNVLLCVWVGVYLCVHVRVRVREKVRVLVVHRCVNKTSQVLRFLYYSLGALVSCLLSSLDESEQAGT